MKISEVSLYVPSKYWIAILNFVFLIRYLIIVNCYFLLILLHPFCLAFVLKNQSRAPETIFKFKFAATKSVINFVNESREGSCVPLFSLFFFFVSFKPSLSIKKKCTCVRYEMHCDKSNYYSTGFSRN